MGSAGARFLRAGLAALALLCMAGAAAFAREAPGTFKVRARSAEESIRARVLQQTPLGASQQTVLLFIEKRLRHEGRPELRNSGARRVTYGPNAVDEQVGASSIDRLEVGRFGEWRYLMLIKTYVYLSWAFDTDGKLIDVIVYKETDSL